MQVVGSNWPKPHYTLLITGLCRFQLVSVLKERPFVYAEVNDASARKLAVATAQRATPSLKVTLFPISREGVPRVIAAVRWRVSG